MSGIRQKVLKGFKLRGLGPDKEAIRLLCEHLETCSDSDKELNRCVECIRSSPSRERPYPRPLPATKILRCPFTHSMHEPEAKPVSFSRLQPPEPDVRVPGSCGRRTETSIAALAAQVSRADSGASSLPTSTNSQPLLATTQHRPESDANQSQFREPPEPSPRPRARTPCLGSDRWSQKSRAQ